MSWGWWPATGATTTGGCGGGKTFPSWYPAGLALVCQHKPHWEQGASPRGKTMYLEQANRAGAASEAAFGTLPLLLGNTAGASAPSRRVPARIYHPTSQFFKDKINEHFIQRIWAAYQEYFQQCTSDTLQIVLTEAKVKCHTLRSDAVCSWKRACTAFRDWQLNPSFFQLPTYGMK